MSEERLARIDAMYKEGSRERSNSGSGGVGGQEGTRDVFDNTGSRFRRLVMQAVDD